MAKQKRKKTSKRPARRKTKARASSRRAVAGAVIRATGIGHVTEIRYRREGRTYQHKFGPGIVLGATSDDQLVIAGKGLRVRPFIED